MIIGSEVIWRGNDHGEHWWDKIWEMVDETRYKNLFLSSLFFFSKIGSTTSGGKILSLEFYKNDKKWNEKKKMGDVKYDMWFWKISMKIYKYKCDDQYYSTIISHHLLKSHFIYYF